MAAPPVAGQIVSPFPTPPIYAQLYTSEAVARGDDALLPPCVHADFTAFGEEYHLNDEVIRPLADTGIRQLYVSKKDWKAEMKKMNSSSLAAYVDLIAILITSPDTPERTDKINDIRDIFINMHHLINEFRPIQARDTLRMMQQKQVRELRATVDDFRDFLVEAKKTFRQSLKMDDIARIPIPAYRPDLEGPEHGGKGEEEGGEAAEKAEGVEGAAGVNGGAGAEEKTTVFVPHASQPRPEQLEYMLQRRRRDAALWRAYIGQEAEGEEEVKMEE